jgi:hypothetical protein
MAALGKIAVGGRLYRQHRAPSVNYPSGSLIGVLAFADCRIAELRKGLQQQDAQPARIALVIRLRVRITLTSDIEAVA